MNIDKFTEKSIQLINDMQTKALQEEHQQLTTVHLLNSFIDDNEGYGLRLLSKAGLKPGQDIKTITEDELKKESQVSGGQLTMSQNLASIIAKAEKISSKWGDNFVAADSLLYSLAKEKGPAHDILKNAGVEAKKLEEVILSERGGQKVESKNVIEAIKDIPKDINGNEQFEPKPETVEKIKLLKQGEKLSKTFNFSRQRLFADKPSKTITTKPTYIHPYEDRFLTPRELARLQSFPDDFHFCGSKTDMVKQIGNAVPVLMASAIAKKLKEVIK